MTAAALAARCLALTDAAPDAPVAVLGPSAGRLRRAVGARGRLAQETGAARDVVVSLLGTRASPATRQALLASVGRHLHEPARLVLVDHNQPRTWARRLLGALLLAARGLPPSRARYPAARELAALGFRVERLRLAAGERVQLVVARAGVRRDGSS